jgi:branched-chain amino acid transport system ATP-binding protein
MLTIEKLSSGYGEAPVLEGVGFSVGPAEVVTVLGSNGAGKTTLLRTISGLISGASGSIRLNGVELLDQSPAGILRAGVAHVPEGRRIFPGLTVAENLLMGGYTVSDKRQLRINQETLFDLFPRLAERRSQVGTTLSGGEQQMLSIARALMSSPSYLLLDEPSMGLAPVVVERLFDSLRALRTRGLGILLVEQNAHVGMDVADRVVVLARGKIVQQSTQKKGVSTEELMAAYLAD